MPALHVLTLMKASAAQYGIVKFSVMLDKNE
jgi:hypothetical protein